jgi:beta-barrel assembly-enhancing protease
MNAAQDFSAEGFDPRLPNGRAAGRLVIDATTVRFVGPESFELPLAGLELKLSGIGYELVLLSHPGHPGLVIAGDAKTLLALPALAALNTKARGERRRVRACLPTLGVLGLILIAAVIGLRGPIIGVVASWVPASFEVAVGDLFFQQVRAEARLIENAEVKAQLDQLAAPLLAVLPPSDHVIDLHLADDATLNAFALPGGNIVIHSAVILKAESVDEVLGVLAHEIGHVKERHSLRQVLGSVGIYVVLQALVGDLSGMAGALAEGSAGLLSLKFSRRQELEADAVGWDYLIAARLDPRGMVRFFERVEAEMRQELGAVAELEGSLSFLSTHPITAERRERLDQRFALLADRDFRKLDFDFAAFQTEIRRLTPSSSSSAVPPTVEEKQ